MVGWRVAFKTVTVNEACDLSGGAARDLPGYAFSCAVKYWLRASCTATAVSICDEHQAENYEWKKEKFFWVWDKKNIGYNCLPCRSRLECYIRNRSCLRCLWPSWWHSSRFTKLCLFLRSQVSIRIALSYNSLNLYKNRHSSTVESSSFLWLLLILLTQL